MPMTLNLIKKYTNILPAGSEEFRCQDVVQHTASVADLEAARLHSTHLVTVVQQYQNIGQSVLSTCQIKLILVPRIARLVLKLFKFP